MGIVVTKFGGSSLADAGQFRKVRDILLADGERRFVVPSAPGRRDADDAKVTDLLYTARSLAAQGREPEFEETFSAVAARYLDIASELGLDAGCIAGPLEQARFAISHGASADYAASRGEFLNGLLLSEYLGWPFLDPAEVIFFDAAGRFDSERTQEALSSRLGKLERAVIPGFFRKRKSPCPIQFYCRDKSVHTINSCGATRLDADHCTLSCILTYAFFDNGVQSPACLLCNSARPQKPIHSSSVIPRFHHPRLSVKHY